MLALLVHADRMGNPCVLEFFQRCIQDLLRYAIEQEDWKQTQFLIERCGANPAALNASYTYTNYDDRPPELGVASDILYAKELHNIVLAYIDMNLLHVSNHALFQVEERRFQPWQWEDEIVTTNVEWEGQLVPVTAIVNKELADSDSASSSEPDEPYRPSPFTLTYESDPFLECRPFLFTRVPDPEVDIVHDGFAYVEDITIAKYRTIPEVYRSVKKIIQHTLFLLANMAEVDILIRCTASEYAITISANDRNKFPRFDIADFPEGYHADYPLYVLEIHLPVQYLQVVVAIRALIQPYSPSDSTTSSEDIDELLLSSSAE